MTQIVKFWHRFSFWMKVKIALIPLSVGGVIATYASDASGFFYGVPPVAYLLVYMIENFIKDEDGNDIVDGFEKKK